MRPPTFVVPASRLALAVCGLCSVSCVNEHWETSSETGHLSQPFVNGADTRVEVYDLAPDSRRAIQQSVAAIMTADKSEPLLTRHVDELPLHGEERRFCEGQRFVDQPAAAFCSGVLVDWNVVLTAAHCTNMYPIEDMRVVFGYYYYKGNRLDVGAHEVYGVSEVLHSRLDPTPAPGNERQRLDYAWLKLDRLVLPPRQPASVYSQDPALAVGDSIVTAGASSGVPIKVDPAGLVRDTGAPEGDFFTADTDTSGGWSGGPAFNSQLAVVGNMTRGTLDFADGDDGCVTDAVEDDPEAASEQFTFAYRAVEGLCNEGILSHLCDPECEQPCAPGPRPDGCSVSPAPRSPGPPLALGLLALGAALRLRRQRRGGEL